MDDDRLRRWQLVLPHRTYLVRIAVRRGMSWHDAEDCAQEAMVRAVGFPNLDETRVLEFLATTTMRLCVDRHRLHQRDVRVGAKLAPWFVDEPSPEEATCDRGEASWVASHVASLPETQRTALTARAEGLSCHEIADRMGMSYKAVESLLSRARAYVRAAVATAWVLVARARRRDLGVPDGVPAMAFAALVTATLLAPAAGPGSAPRVVALPPARSVLAQPPAVAAVVAPARPRLAAPTPFVVAPPQPPVQLPPATDPPKVPRVCTGVDVPHTEECIPLDDWEPGQNLDNCLHYGVNRSALPSLECNTTEPEGETR